MIDTYDNCLEIKTEIEEYIKLINKNNIFQNTQIITGTAKYILFFKQLQIYREDKHFAKCMIYDLLLTMHSITQHSLKTFYSMYRSFIENFVRFILDKDDFDDTGVRNLFNELAHLCKSPREIEIKEFIEGEYGKCCDYVHSNINAKLNIYEYYTDIIEKDKLNYEIRFRLINYMLTFLKNACELMIRLKNNWVDIAFYRNKQKLKFLLNKRLYDLYIEKSK